MADCIDSNISGEVPHEALLRKQRCEFHHELRARWRTMNTKRRVRGSREAPVEWRDYVRPRPERLRDIEVSDAQVADITAAVAEVASLRAPLDQAIRNGLLKVDSGELSDLADALDTLLDALHPITRRR